MYDLLVSIFSNKKLTSKVINLPGEGNGSALQYSCLGNPMDRGAWRATDHGVKKKENFFLSILCIFPYISIVQEFYASYLGV